MHGCHYKGVNLCKRCLNFFAIKNKEAQYIFACKEKQDLQRSCEKAYKMT